MVLGTARGNSFDCGHGDTFDKAFGSRDFLSWDRNPWPAYLALTLAAWLIQRS